MRVISSPEELKQLAGREIAVSEWVLVDQPQVDAFAAVTGDNQWIHIDPKRSKSESPYGGTVAHGFLNLALLPMLVERSLTIKGFRLMLNYGLNRVRFPAPLPVGSRIRARVFLKTVEEIGRDTQTTWEITMEREEGGRPACVAELLVRHIL